MESKMNKSKDKNNVSSLELNNYLYNCAECSSNIEILSLDENYINFICNKQHNLNIEINEYLKKMKQYCDINLNCDKCDKHKKQ